MLSQLLFVATYAAVVSAQIEFLNGTIVCPGPGDFCSGNIIIRCGSDGIGQPGNCDDNLAGEPPLGVGNSNCWETSPTSGDAACSKK
ncbi:uncharacterized protein K444DRAFT_394444 [Hyaloscypha bicolor E]|uniref:Uncharacterized protein n=1 Tax=Hyaloscypha bicolor E TaxID=1095630 RepID=A0A2J6TBU7_9HELO|nr:uncharacterized protein K444DRAFT_394444 [Hyaloscypha bicolor E]PMD60505.1 hypothetical protein K444DRAFT_394444 [Hyaloscypha bicolor E]